MFSFFSVQTLAPFGLLDSRGGFALCLCTLYVLVFQSTAAEMKVGKRWKRNIHFILSPTVLLRPVAFALSLFLSLALCSCLFVSSRKKAAPSLIICVCVCVHAWDRMTDDSDCVQLCILPFFNLHNPFDVIHTSSDSLTNMSQWINWYSENKHWPQERVVLIRVSLASEPFKWIN